MADRPESTGGTSVDAAVSRRRLLTGGAFAIGGAALAGAGAASVLRSQPDGPAPKAPAPTGTMTVPFYGVHQAGVETPPQANAAFVAFDLLVGNDRDAVIRLMRMLTDDAARLTQGRPALADTEPELAHLPSGLTVTFGFGPGLFRAAGVEDRRPPSVAPLPSFAIDKLDPRWTGGDLLVQICADD
ncbi:MAG: Dyp-type peroxidase, partial [Longispora sp.]|nr:Dyp-type peroxidase [Longispora sp. (in: high G+C Gram-positive bacteria)]